MAKEKNKPVPVRFNLRLLETLKEEEKIDTPQQALNFLSEFWENNRPAKEEFLNGLSGTKPVSTSMSPAEPPAKEKKAGKKDETAGPHPGLSGIDLSIWKAEQRDKNKSL